MVLPLAAAAGIFAGGAGLNLFGGSRSAKKAKKAAEEAARQRAALLQGYTGLEIVEPTRTATGQINASNIKSGQVISPLAQQIPELQLVGDTYQMPEQAQQNLQLVQAETSKRALGMPDSERQMILQKAREDFTKAKTEAGAETAAQNRAMGLTGGKLRDDLVDYGHQVKTVVFNNFIYVLRGGGADRFDNSYINPITKIEEWDYNTNQSKRVITLTGVSLGNLYHFIIYPEYNRIRFVGGEEITTGRTYSDILEIY